jgi:hypothetical protein
MEINFMNRLTVIFFLAIALAPIALTSAQPVGSCSAGKLLDVQMETILVNAGTAEQSDAKTKRGGHITYSTYLVPLTQQRTIYTVTVRLDDIVYTAQSESVFGLGFKPTSFVINDPIQGCLRGTTLALTCLDGKEYKARIVRAVRDPQRDPGRQ